MDNAGEGRDHQPGWRRRGMAIAAAGALLIGVAACGGDDDDASASDDTGTTGSEAEELLGPENVAEGEPVLIGFVSDGATDAFDNTDEIRAAQATAEYWNTHKGGIGGRPIEVVPCEAKGDPATAASCANQLVEDQVVAVALSQSAAGPAVWEPLHQAGVPTFFFQASDEAMAADTASSFLMVNPLAVFLGVPLGAAKESGSDKIAFVNIDVPQALSQFESGAVQDAMDNVGLEYELIKVPPGAPDATAQMQQVVDSGAGVVHITGNDATCIASIQGLNALGYDGEITSISQCVTDATREALPAESLEGVSLLSLLAIGDDDDAAYQLYQAVVGTYGEDVEDVDNALGMGAYTTMASLGLALEGIEGDITHETVIETIKSMDEADYPGAEGLTFQCGGSASPDQPAVCSNGALRAVLDASGEATTYEPSDASDALQ